MSVPLPAPSPDYYRRGGVDAAEIVNAYDLNYWRGSAVAHVLRAGQKDGETDLQAIENAIQCLLREAERLRSSS